MSTYVGTACVGAIFSSWLSNWSRKWSILIAGVVAGVGVSIQAGAVNVSMLIVGRIIAGFASGMISVSFPIYAAEIAPPSLRGLLGGLYQTMFSVGNQTGSAISYSMELHHTGPFQWRFPLAFQVVPSLLLVLGCLFVPESPRHLIKQGRDQEAAQAIRRLHYNGKNADWCDREFREIQEHITLEEQLQIKSWSLLVTNTFYRKRMFVAGFLMVATQWSGINIVFYYGPTVYKSLGFGTQQTLMIQLILTCLSSSWVLGWAWASDRIGRKKPLIIGAVMMAISLLVLVVLIKTIQPGNSNGFRAIIAMIFLIVFWYNPMGTICWTYLGEVFPFAIRAKGGSIAAICNWVNSTAVAQASPTALDTLKENYYFVFIACNIASALVFYFFFPETNGRTLEKIDEVFGDRQVTQFMDLDKGGVELVEPHVEDVGRSVAEVPEDVEAHIVGK